MLHRVSVNVLTLSAEACAVGLAAGAVNIRLHRPHQLTQRASLV